MKHVNKIENLKKSVEVVEKMPMMQKAAHVMPLVNELIGVLEGQQAEIDELKHVIMRMSMKGDY